MSDQIAIKCATIRGDAGFEIENRIFDKLQQNPPYCPHIAHSFLRFPNLNFMQLLPGGDLERRLRSRQTIDPATGPRTNLSDSRTVIFDPRISFSTPRTTSSWPTLATRRPLGRTSRWVPHRTPECLGMTLLHTASDALLVFWVHAPRNSQWSGGMNRTMTNGTGRITALRRSKRCGTGVEP